MRVVRTLSETALRRMVSGFRMLRRMAPAAAAICACWVGAGIASCSDFLFTLHPQFGITIGVTRISSFTSVSRQYFRSPYLSRASQYLTGPASASDSASVAMAWSALSCSSSNMSTVRRSACFSSIRVRRSRNLSSSTVIRSPTSSRTRYLSRVVLRSSKSLGGNSWVFSFSVASLWNAFWTRELAVRQ